MSTSSAAVGRDTVSSVVTGLTDRFDFLSVAVNHQQTGIRACIPALVRDNAIEGTRKNSSPG